MNKLTINRASTGVPAHSLQVGQAFLDADNCVWMREWHGIAGRGTYVVNVVTGEYKNVEHFLGQEVTPVDLTIVATPVVP